jgi:hypothetical protein
MFFFFRYSLMPNVLIPNVEAALLDPNSDASTHDFFNDDELIFQHPVVSLV